MKGNVATAFPIATEIADAGDWTFDGLYGWKNQFPEARQKMDEFAARYSCLIFTVKPHDLHSQQVAFAVMMERYSDDVTEPAVGRESD